MSLPSCCWSENAPFLWPGSLHFVCCTHGQSLLTVARVKWERLLGCRVCGRMRAERKETDGEAPLTSQSMLNALFAMEKWTRGIQVFIKDKLSVQQKYLRPPWLLLGLSAIVHWGPCVRLQSCLLYILYQLMPQLLVEWPLIYSDSGEMRIRASVLWVNPWKQSRGLSKSFSRFGMEK